MEVEVDKAETSSSMHEDEFSLDEVLSTKSDGSKPLLNAPSDGGWKQKEVIDSELMFTSTVSYYVCLIMLCGFLVLISKLISWQDWARRGGSKKIIDHFHDLVPDMALHFPFELDAFQKEVLIVHNSLFVYWHSYGYLNLRMQNYL